MVVIGMFDDSRSLEVALSRLSEAGLDERVERLEGPPSSGSPGAGGASEGGAAPGDLARSENISAPWPGSTRAGVGPEIGFGELDAEERDYYDRLLRDGGRILVLRVDDGRVEEATRVLDESGASRVARHEG